MGMTRAMQRWRLGTRVPAWAESFNLAGPRNVTAPWAWLILAVGVGACLAVWPEVERAEAEHHEAQADLQRLQRAQHQLQLAQQAKSRPMDPAVGAADQAPALSGEQAQHAAQTLAWLAYPWLANLQQAEDAADDSHALLLSWALDLTGWTGQSGSQPAVRIGATVADDGAALRLAQALGPRAQLLSRVTLGSPVATARGSLGLRAELAWLGGAP